MKAMRLDEIIKEGCIDREKNHNLDSTLRPLSFDQGVGADFACLLFMK